jgi:hypothetical protein
LEVGGACDEAEWIPYTKAEVQKAKQLLQKLPFGDGAQEKELVETVRRLQAAVQQLVSETDVLLKEEVKSLQAEKAAQKAEFEVLLAAQRAQFEER